MIEVELTELLLLETWLDNIINRVLYVLIERGIKFPRKLTYNFSSDSHLMWLWQNLLTN